MSKAGSDPGLWSSWQISVPGHQKRSKNYRAYRARVSVLGKWL